MGYNCQDRDINPLTQFLHVSLVREALRWHCFVDHHARHVEATMVSDFDGQERMVQRSQRPPGNHDQRQFQGSGKVGNSISFRQGTKQTADAFYQQGHWAGCAAVRLPQSELTQAVGPGHWQLREARQDQERTRL